MNAFDRLMYDYYRVLNNAWKREIKESAYLAISTLADMPAAERLDTQRVNQLMAIINQNLGADFAAEVSSQTKSFIERSLRLGIQDVRQEVKSRISIGIYGLQDASLATTLQQQNLFWIANHFGTDIQADFTRSLHQALDQGFTRDQLADLLKTQFQDLGQKSSHYWQGLAEHTALRVREFGRLSGYEKAGARYYRLVNPMDDRTSEICRVLVGQGKIYPLDTALEVRDNLMAIDMQAEGMEAARAHIKALAPWVKDSQIVRDPDGNPTGVQGPHTPFPPFHWKCRTVTEIVL